MAEFIGVRGGDATPLLSSLIDFVEQFIFVFIFSFFFKCAHPDLFAVSIEFPFLNVLKLLFIFADLGP